MPVTPSPHLVFNFVAEREPTPLEFFDFALKAADSGIVPSGNPRTVTFSGDVQLTGNLDASTRNEIERLDPEVLFQSYRADIRGPGNKPRLILGVQPGTGISSFNYQHVPNDALRAQGRTVLGDFRDFLKEPAGAAKRTASTLPSSLKAGVVVDAYELVKRLGAGFSAEVWRAKLVSPRPGVPVEVGHEVALKLYTRLTATTTDTLRIQREFHVATQVEHPHLVRVFYLVLSPSRPHHNFLAMELVKGRTLKSKSPEGHAACEDRLVRP